jgi:polysaccharide deacetylase family protein (PEP-CTERM system associated)
MDNILTIDLEEWYHPEYVKNKELENKKERIMESLNITLQLLREYSITSTFFVVGELVEKHPEIIGQILSDGHEIAFHGFDHEPLWRKSPKQLKTEINRFELILRRKCKGFRAPSFSLDNRTRWALKVLEEAEYEYDSSIFPFKTTLYGVFNSPLRPYKPSFESISEEDENTKLWEFPIFVFPLNGIRIPVGGGFYLRFFPLMLIRKAIKAVNAKGIPAVLFCHNWELDDKTPRMKLGLYHSFVTYYNLKKTKEKLQSILSNFEFTSVKRYLKEHLN